MIEIKEILKQMIEAENKPLMFEYTKELFWNDPYISKQMLKAHLNPEHDAASRNPKAILKTVNHLFETGVLKEGMRVLDLGCGPGLYSEMIQARGVHVVGLDGSENSIAYARERNSSLGLGIEYVQMDFFDMTFYNEFDVVLQIYGEINTFSPENRDRLLGLIRCALKEEGTFVFDATTRKMRDLDGAKSSWYASEAGFWSGEPHLVLEQAFDYPNASVWLEQYVVTDTQGLKIYRNWFQDHDINSIQKVIENNGFKLEHHWGDLTGEPYTEESQWMGVVAKKAHTRFNSGQNCASHDK